MSGKLIAIYGIPRSGKTTQIELLEQAFRRKEHKTQFVKYPIFDQKPSGEFLNEFLNKGKHEHISERELQLWFTLNRLQYQPVLKERIDEGVIMITENYTGMSIAYGLLAGVAKGWLVTINDLIVKPDISIVLQCDRVIEEALPNDRKTLRELQQHYQELANEYAWYKVNGDQTMMEVHTEIWEIIRKVII